MSSRALDTPITTAPEGPLVPWGSHGRAVLIALTTLGHDWPLILAPGQPDGKYGSWDLRGKNWSSWCGGLSMTKVCDFLIG